MFGLEWWGSLERPVGRDNRSSALDIRRWPHLSLTARKCGTDGWIREPGVWDGASRVGLGASQACTQAYNWTRLSVRFRQNSEGQRPVWEPCKIKRPEEREAGGWPRKLGSKRILEVIWMKDFQGQE